MTATETPAASDNPYPDADANAPYGYVKDRATGEIRPRKRAGRKGALATAEGEPPDDEWKAGGPIERDPDGDRAPGEGRRRGNGKRGRGTHEPQDVPPFRAGPIAKGVNRLYRRVGRIVRAADPMVGQAIIEMTRRDPGDEDDVTVGEAWEEIARTNPRIRAVLLKLITSGAWTQLFMAHTPLFAAILMKDGIRERIPLVRLLDALTFDEDDQDEDGQDEGAPPGGAPPGLGTLLSGLTPADMAQVQHMMGAMMGRAANGAARSAAAAGGPPRAAHLASVPDAEQGGP